jgi:hypothetical protein
VTIYSTRFIGEEVPSGYGRLYTVPIGHVAVVRSITVVSAAPGTSDAQVVANGLWYLWRVDPLAAGVTAYWNGRHVLNAGDTLQTYIGGGAGHWTISGYLLTLP